MSNLFNETDVKDTSATAIKETDTRIQRMSKLFAKKALLPGQSSTIMVAYQKGAKDMEPLVLKELCRDCPSKRECQDLDLYSECEEYNNIKRLSNS